MKSGQADYMSQQYSVSASNTGLWNTVMGFGHLICHLLAWEEHRTSHHARFRQTGHWDGSSPGINTNWEKYPTNFLKAFLVFLISGSSSLLQSLSLSQRVWGRWGLWNYPRLAMGEIGEETGPWDIKKPDRWETKAKGFLKAESTNCRATGDI